MHHRLAVISVEKCTFASTRVAHGEGSLGVDSGKSTANVAVRSEVVRDTRAQAAALADEAASQPTSTTLEVACTWPDGARGESSCAKRGRIVVEMSMREVGMQPRPCLPRLTQDLPDPVQFETTAPAPCDAGRAGRANPAWQRVIGQCGASMQSVWFWSHADAILATLDGRAHTKSARLLTCDGCHQQDTGIAT